MRFQIVDRQDENSRAVAERWKKILLEKGWEYTAEHPELIFCIGGDGTILRAIHHHLDTLDKVAFVGIHTGTLGFLTDYTQEELDALSEDMSQPPHMELAPLLEVHFPETGETIFALNEVRIESTCRTLNMDVCIDGEFFEHTTGSGLCISTQSGSTAINRALGGAVMDSGLNALQLCEIMPISHKNHHSLRNPYIMKSDRKITLTSQDFLDGRLSYDHKQKSLEGISRLEIKMADKVVRFARYRPYSYLKRLKNLY